MTDVIVTAAGADNIVCPFTGKKIVVHMFVHPGSVVFCAPDAFTLAEPVADLETLYLKASMRGGITSTIDRKNVVDPYTGKQLKLRVFPDGRMSFVGGFNPRAAVDSLEKFMYMATQRGGIPVMDPPEGFSAEKVSRKRALRHKDLSVSQDTLDMAEKAVDRAGLVKKSVRGASIRSR